MNLHTNWLRQQKEKRLQQPLNLSVFCQPLGDTEAFTDNERCLPSA